MIVTDRFVFVHMHKTGGQTVNSIIESAIPNHRSIGYHYPVSELPDDAAHLPVVGIVRNPWDWYVSWYAFNCRPGNRNPLFQVVSGAGSADFITTVTNLVKLGADRPQSVEHRQQLLAMLPPTLDGNRGAGLTRSCMQELVDSGQGYLSWLFARMLGGPERKTTRIGRFERLESDFVAILDELGVPETGAVKAAFERRERANVSRHSHYSHYYDEALRDLVGDRDRTLVDGFDYAFDARKPGNTAYAMPSDAGMKDQRAFRKLLGREDNFLRLNDVIDVEPLREKLADLPAERWSESDRHRIFNVHRHTRSVSLVHFEDNKHETPQYYDLYDEFRDVLQPVVDYISSYYSDNGFIVRALLAKLNAGGDIPKHTDAGYSLMNCHRVHLPLITNEEVDFFVGDETIHMRAGELWEINNATTHGVTNRGSEDRVHLIIDWMPNHRGRPEAMVLKGDELDDDERAAANSMALASIVDQALKLQRSGQLAKAESLYRQVLHFDPSHVAANNLLGLACLRTRRFDEAARHIERALEVAPDDAQAHANLGLALKECGRPDEAVEHLKQSLDLVPGNPRVLSNLGSLLLVRGRADEAVDCFRRALAVEPGFAEVHFNLGSTLLHLERYEEAADSLRHCVSLRPDFAEARRRLEKAQSLLGARRSAHH